MSSMNMPEKVGLRAKSFVTVNYGDDYVYLAFWASNGELDHQFSCSKAQARELAAAIIRVVERSNAKA